MFMWTKRIYATGEFVNYVSLFDAVKSLSENDTILDCHGDVLFVRQNGIVYKLSINAEGDVVFTPCNLK